ncbi:hypothetical protein [Sciscionella marina]|uniref:hypothetical protein n=1 Tax=Sciscionella marina TaxID=508770 RepID=UPI0003A9B8E0|nr:hypothetical protein [Sciscionella marina]
MTGWPITLPGRVRALPRRVRALPGRVRALPGKLRALPAEQVQRRCAVLAIIAAVLAAALGVTGALLRSDNEALVDAGKTSELTDRLRGPLTQVLSYDYADLDNAHKAARGLFTGAAVRQYDALFGRIRDTAQSKRLIVTTIVRNLGVVSLHGDRAELLGLVDQQIMSGAAQQRSGTAQLRLVAHRDPGGSWKVTELGVL